MEVSWNGGTPSSHPFLDRIFHEINQPAIGDPPWLWKRPYGFCGFENDGNLWKGRVFFQNHFWRLPQYLCNVKAKQPISINRDSPSARARRVHSKISRPTCVTSPWKIICADHPKISIVPFYQSLYNIPITSCLIFVNIPQHHPQVPKIPRAPVKFDRSKVFGAHCIQSSALIAVFFCSSTKPCFSKKSLFLIYGDLSEMCPKKKYGYVFCSYNSWNNYGILWMYLITTVVFWKINIRPRNRFSQFRGLCLFSKEYKALITAKGYNCGKALVSSNKQSTYGSPGF